MPSDLKQVAIIGAGQMGNGIAHVISLAGYDVLINDLQRDAYDRARQIIEKNMARQVSKGLISDGERNAALDRITWADAIGDIAQADLVIEAATEEEDVKRAIFDQVCPKLKPEALLATNTSSISITRLAATTDRPER
ncbi:MAG: 3-hydroxyacyl-CoA dehydrogenase NAD-binding domain-containing protein, partial [Pseudomonadota bacterium]